MNLNVKDVFIRFSLESGGLSYNLFVEYSKELKFSLFQISGLSLKDVEIVKEICSNKSKAILYKKEEKHSFLCKFVFENYQEKKIRIENEEEILIPSKPYISWDSNDTIKFFNYNNTTTSPTTGGDITFSKDTLNRLTQLGI